ncbi:MAG TPA: 30S ribosomal protein S9 [Elusimicrobiota bacterium]|mgnify:CR=1 FL=1|jgi:small subunit ribosomal protein S9|nr:30S ribosomal protein S9 [Elusimicrobiota bacterium]HMU96636.1 30S ribosomal protein S9 [Elusimicrobiota bacterium]HMX43714.1 30S ribosomal protein S9 [Elusimicrobiota bacterium]HMX94358.1 30S ribosomal protein S9 [Elusimicrobiota bacterium]HMZ27078.1 30S ribosomal protein S9 [Elusimicrobiota bacterium]
MTSETIEITRQNPLWATGRRKTAIARVRLIPGEGRVTVNGKSVETFFGGNERQKASALAPFRVSNALSTFDIIVSTTGGGITGQADAIRLGLSRALVTVDPKLRTPLRAKGFLTRDPRAVERKKAGQPKARRRYQHSKR